MVIKVIKIILYLIGIGVIAGFLYLIGLIGTLAFVLGNFKLAFISFGLILLTITSLVFYFIEVIKERRSYNNGK